jgi:hypothetical protein
MVVKVIEDLAAVVDALGQSEPQLPGSEGGCAVLLQVVQLGPALAPNLQNVLESHGGDQCRASPLALKQSVGGHRGPVYEVGVGTVDAHLVDTLYDPQRWILGCGWELVNGQLTVFQDCNVSECAANVDSNHGAGRRQARPL